jgi:serine/threonine protein kinase
MSPEQAQGMSATYSSDIFCVSAILYYLVTGTRPFSRSTPLATLAAVVKGEFEAPHKRNPKLNLLLSEIISRGLSKDPAQRFCSASEFKTKLQAYLSSLGIGEEFTFKTWMNNPQDFVYKCLSSIAENLTNHSHKLLSLGQWQNAALSISHLALVAPESHSIVELAMALDKTRRKKSFWKFVTPAALLLLLVSGAAGSLVYYYNSNSKAVPSQTKNLEPKSQSIMASVPSAVPEAQPVAPKFSPTKNVAPEIKDKIKTPPPKAPTAGVFFDVAPEIQVFWNNKQMKSGQRLWGQVYGDYRLKLVRPGFDPIHQKITINSPETINIRAR